MTFSEMLVTICTSAVVAAVVGSLVNELLMRWRNSPSERLDALKAAVVLEGYAMDCASGVADHQARRESDGVCGAVLGGVPDLPDLRIAASFLKRKRVKVADLLACFPQEVQRAQQEVAFWWEVYHDKESTDALRLTACVGLHALRLAEELRQAFRLPRRELNGGKINTQDILEAEAKNCRES